MKKTQFLWLFGLFFILTANSQTKTETRSIGNFSKIESRGSTKVVLVSGNANSLTIEGDENSLKNLITEVEGNTLKIYYGGNKKISVKGNVTVKVPVKQLEGVSLSGSGSITSESSIKANNFSASLNGSGKIDLEKIESEAASIRLDGSGKIELGLSTNTADAKINGSGKMELEGKANVFSASVNGSGYLDASELVSVTADTSVHGSGILETHATKDLTASVHGSGNIKYNGNPAVKKNINGSGKVVKS